MMNYVKRSAPCIALYNADMSILLVEDDASLAAGLTEALRSEGFAINHVNTGNDALHVISTEPPDVVILDLGLPDIDGLEVLKQLRIEHAEMPVLLLTARDSLSDKVAGLDSGADDYLAKPFEMDELLARLRALSRRVSTTRVRKGHFLHVTGRYRGRNRCCPTCRLEHSQ